MANCKACGEWFVSFRPTELCMPCERALKRLGKYVAPVVHGRWIKGVPVGFSGKPDGYRCSVCKAVILGMPPLYCQRCGSKMDKEDTDGN